MTKLSSDAETVEETVIKQDEEELIRSLVNELPEKMRIVILMYYMEEMSVDEISKALHIPAGTVKSRMHQAKNRLREGMVQYEG